jgi:hypothetical protein
MLLANGKGLGSSFGVEALHEHGSNRLLFASWHPETGKPTPGCRFSAKRGNVIKWSAGS